MSSFPILDLVIGMIFIYFLLSIICSSAVELWFSILNTRAKLLAQWLTQIFDSPALDSNGKPVLVLDKDGKPKAAVGADKKPKLAVDKNGQKIASLDQNGNQLKDQNGKLLFEVEYETVSLGKEIMNHCIVTALSKTGKSTSYIDAENFVTALLDKITISQATSATNSVQIPPPDLPAYITAIQQSTSISGELKRTILALANEASLAAKAINTIPAVANVTNNITTEIKSEMELFRLKLEKWYDMTADRITGTLKRTKAMPATIIIGLLFTIGLNADSVAISQYFYSHPEESKKFAEKAVSELQKFNVRIDSMKSQIKTNDTIKQTTIDRLEKEKRQLQNDVNTLTTSLPESLPIGWKNENHEWRNHFCNSLLNTIKIHLLGWLATILAISLGAPFWFDVLNKIANLRGTGPKPASSSNTNT